MQPAATAIPRLTAAAPTAGARIAATACSTRASSATTVRSTPTARPAPPCTQTCGDGWAQPLEECDDGNLAVWIGASSSSSGWTLRHYDGNTWTTSASGTQLYGFRDMWGDGAADVVFAVGWVLGTTNGFVMRRAAGRAGCRRE